MVMQSTACREDLYTLGQQLQSLFGEIPLGIHCSLRNGKLIVLGQHHPEAPLEPTQTLNALERTIQACYRGLPRQVRLYLRVIGQTEPYAQHRFVTLPPVPPPNPALWAEADQSSRQPWVPEDEELGDLMQELITPTSQAIVHHPTPAPEMTLQEPVAGPQATFTGGESVAKTRVALALGVAALGIAGGTYGLTRPCVLGACQEIQDGQTFRQQSNQNLQTARTSQDLKNIRQQLQQTIAKLEPIPLWSMRHGEAQTLLQENREKLAVLDQVIPLEETAAATLQKSQQPNVDLNWQALRQTWKQTIYQLSQVPAQGPLSPYIQRKLEDARTQLSRVEQQIQLEKQAQIPLIQAREAIKLAEVRREKARTLADWQLLKATWQMAVNRLGEIPAGTAAAREASKLLPTSQGELAKTLAQLNEEQTAARLFDQANQAAVQAQAAEQSADWAGAIAQWNTAIASVKQTPGRTSYQSQATALLTSYNKALAQAQSRLQTLRQIQAELDKVCTGQLKLCNAMEVGSAIKVQLDTAYVQAIEAARASGNHDLQAIVADHQLTLKHSLERLSASFRLPIEVYDPANTLLDRHVPPVGVQG